MRKQGVLLKQKPDAALLGRQRHAALAIEPCLAGKIDSPALRPLEAGQHAQDCRLAAARRAEQDGHARSLGRPAQLTVDGGAAGEPLFEIGHQFAAHNGSDRRDRAYVMHKAVKAKIKSTAALCPAAS